MNCSDHSSLNSNMTKTSSETGRWCCHVRYVIDLLDDDDDDGGGGGGGVEREGDGGGVRVSNSPIRSFTPVSEATDCLIDFRQQQQQQRSRKLSRRRR